MATRSGGRWRPAWPADADAGYRDPEAERAILAELGLPQAQLEPSRLTGMDTVKFSTETLPMLAGRADVEVEISGEPADYREVSDSLRVEVSAAEIIGENDWFGLEVLVFVEDQRVPFKDLFLALSRGQQYLLLPGGAYFSLDKPGLQALARLYRGSAVAAGQAGREPADQQVPGRALGRAG